MIQTLTKNWLLLALCGVLEVAVSVLYFCMPNQARLAVFLGRLILAAGVCTIAAGIWRSAQGRCWLLVLNGLALSAFGVLLFFTRFRISFLAIALLVILMAMSAGVLELATARTLRRERHVADGWFLGSAGVASVGFALAFLALGFRWIKIEPGSHLDLLWLGAYFGFSAVCMLAVALRLQKQRMPILLIP